MSNITWKHHGNFTSNFRFFFKFKKIWKRAGIQICQILEDDHVEIIYM